MGRTRKFHDNLRTRIENYRKSFLGWKPKKEREEKEITNSQGVGQDDK